MHFDIKNHWKRKPSPYIVSIEDSVGVAMNKLTFDPELCLSIERVDGPIPIVLIRNCKQIFLVN